MSVRVRQMPAPHTGETLALPGTAAWKRTQPAATSTRTEILRDVLDAGLDDMLQRFSDVDTPQRCTYLPNLMSGAGRTGPSAPVVVSTQSRRDAPSAVPADSAPTQLDAAGSDSDAGISADERIGSGTTQVPILTRWLEDRNPPEATYGEWTATAFLSESQGCSLADFGSLLGLSEAGPAFLVPHWYLATSLSGLCGLGLEVSREFPLSDTGLGDFQNQSVTDSPGGVANSEESGAGSTAEEDSSGEASPVEVVARIARILGVTQLDILRGTGIIERTFYDWKANRRVPRLASLGSLWALDQATTDLTSLLSDAKAWLRADSRRRELLQDGRFDELVQMALDSTRVRTTVVPGTTGRPGTDAPGGLAADDTVLELPSMRRAPRRTAIKPRRPRQRPRPQSDPED